MLRLEGLDIGVVMTLFAHKTELQNATTATLSVRVRFLIALTLVIVELLKRKVTGLLVRWVARPGHRILNMHAPRICW